jgi:hypothetical protein
VFHETSTVDKRSYKVSISSAKKFEKNNDNFNKMTNQSIIETFIRIKKDKKPFAKNKITLSVYKDFLTKNKI